MNILVLELVVHHGELDDRDLVSLALVCKRVSVSAQFELSKRRDAWKKNSPERAEYIIRLQILRKQYRLVPEIVFPTNEMLEKMNLAELKATYGKLWSEVERLCKKQRENPIRAVLNTILTRGVSMLWNYESVANIS